MITSPYLTVNMKQVEARHFPDDGETPNHPILPLVLVRGTDAARAADPAAWFEERFAANGWGGSWRWGVYDFHHFHSNTHGVLGVARGEAELLLGGAHGERFEVTVGDVLVIPAGVGHKCERGSADFQVVGAYPGSIEPDLLRPGDGDSRKWRDSILGVARPARDPVFGPEGPLLRHWTA